MKPHVVLHPISESDTGSGDMGAAQSSSTEIVDCCSAKSDRLPSFATSIAGQYREDPSDMFRNEMRNDPLSRHRQGLAGRGFSTVQPARTFAESAQSSGLPGGTVSYLNERVT